MKQIFFALAAILLLTTLAVNSARADKGRSPSLIGDFGLDDEVAAPPAGKNGRSDLTGEIRIEEEVNQVDPYTLNEQSALVFFKSFEEKLSGLAAEKLVTIGEIDKGVNLHLTGVYLYCLIAKGTCPELLDAILEVDVVNSRLIKKAQCPNMVRFWKAWAANGLDKKHSFQIQTGYLKKWEYFKANLLVRYLRCTNTVSQEIALEAKISDAAYFKERYGQNSLQRDSVLQTIKLLEFIKAKVPNVFRATKAAQ